MHDLILIYELGVYIFYLSYNYVLLLVLNCILTGVLVWVLHRGEIYIFIILSIEINLFPRSFILWAGYCWFHIGISADMLFATGLRPVRSVKYSTVGSDSGYTV